jgi:glycosyltransferase involved in cell wall biosynthesis
MKSAVCVTNAPAPYREKVHELASKALGGDYHVIYCQKREPNRQWGFKPGSYSRSFLRPSFLAVGERFIHANPEVWAELDELDPAVVITNGFNPTFLIAFVWCMAKKRKHISFHDGWKGSESNLTFIHVLVRKLVYRRSAAFIAASRHGLDWFREYGCPEQALFQSPLCADNERFGKFAGVTPKQYDIAFSGQFIDRKLPQFFVEVASLLKAKKPDLRVLLMGDGPQREAVLEALKTRGISFHYAGFVAQADLPQHYASAEMLLFPTRLDPWGVVANEACAAGIPVITSPNAGVAGDLILDGYDGFVLELDAAVWCDHALRLLTDRSLLDAFSKNALTKVQEYNYAAAAEGIVAALRFCGIGRKGSEASGV